MFFSSALFRAKCAKKVSENFVGMATLTSITAAVLCTDGRIGRFFVVTERPKMMNNTSKQAYNRLAYLC